MDDLNLKKYELLREQIEFYRSKALDESLSTEQRSHFVRKYSEVVRNAAEYIKLFKSANGLCETPEEQSARVSEVRKRAAEHGVELRIDQVRDIIYPASEESDNPA